MHPAIFQLFAQLTHFFALILWAAAALALLADYRSPGSGMRALANAIVLVILSAYAMRRGTAGYLTTALGASSISPPFCHGLGLHLAFHGGA